MPREKLTIDAPTVVVFKSLNKKGEIINIKKINKQIDEINDENYKIPGIKGNDIILEMGVGESLFNYYTKKYNLKK